MRSFDRAMPEELNRVLTDHLSDAAARARRRRAVANLEREGVAGRVELVGDVMVDVALLFQPRAREPTTRRCARRASTPGEYVLATAHRAGNVDDPARLRALVDLLLALPLPVVLPLHPRTRARLEAAGWLGELEAAAHVRLLPPLGYLAFTALLVARPRGAHRLGRRAEGGLPRRRAVRDAARHDRVGRDRRRRAGTCSSTSTPTRRWPRWSARRPPSAPSSTATGTRASASSPRSIAALTASAAADAPQRHAGGGEARAVEQRRGRRRRAHAGQVVGAQRARSRRGRPAGWRRPTARAVPGLEAERAQLVVVVERVGRERLGAARRRARRAARRRR